MGMTIDKTIEFFNGLECHTPQAKDARDIAVETMRKYQQIIDAMLMNDMVENIYFAIEEILKDDLEQDERFGK